MKLSANHNIYLGNTFMSSLPFVVLAGLTGFTSVTLFSDVCFAKSKKVKVDTTYVDSFGKTEATEQEAQDGNMTIGAQLEVPSMNSFPVRVQVDGSNVNGWLQPDNVPTPSKISKTFKIANCQFELKGSDYSVRQYNSENLTEMQVVADAVMPQSTFNTAASSQVIFSLTASLTVVVDEKNKTTCKEALGKKMFYIGRASMEGSVLYGVGSSGDAVNASVLKQENPSKIFISWNNETQQIAVADHLGMVPEIESSIYSFSFTEKDTYYLGFDHEFKLSKDKQKVAKK